MKKGIPQEALKCFACLTMLLDHIGASMVTGPAYLPLRMIGRVAFPIFCFLLAEGAHYTRNPRRYALRLTVWAVLSELPFDYCLFGGLTWQYQSVMLTMLLGFLALETMKRSDNPALKLLLALPFAAAAELLQTDYGGNGVLLIVLFGLTRELPHRLLWQTIGMALICGVLMPGAAISLGGISFGIELLAVLAMIPITLYSGRKCSYSPALQWGFYLFYPAHLTVLYLLQVLGV